MTFLILFTVLALALVASTFRALHDGRGPQRPPASHREDPAFRAPAAG